MGDRFWRFIDWSSDMFQDAISVAYIVCAVSIVVAIVLWLAGVLP